MKITLYQSADMSITPGKTWLAHMDLGSSLFMSFFGATEEAALERANVWYEGERKKYDRKEGNGPIVGAETIADDIDSTASQWSSSWDTIADKAPIIANGPRSK